LIGAVGGDASAASLGAHKAIAPVPSVIQRADRGDVAVVIVGVGRASNTGHRMGVCVAHPGVRARVYIARYDGAHEIIVSSEKRILRCLGIV
jgi:hypothetical protein